MDRLRATFESLGFDNVMTFIASGNVIFSADDGRELAASIEGALQEQLGFEVPTYLRTDTEVIQVADSKPFRNMDHVEVSFLPAEPDPEAARALEATASGSDHLAVIGRQVYWGHPEQRSDSDHSEADVVRILGMATTQRSLRTVRRIADTFLR